MNFSYEQLKEITGGKALIINDTSGKFSISTDTRTIKKGDVYLPLTGESFDGENFIKDALNKEAYGYFTTRFENNYPDAKFAILVDDTKTAYLELANFYRNAINPTTIAITGSSGKTTTKEITSAIFEANYPTHKSKLNHNNEIGLCQTILSMNKSTKFLITEMGMRGLGEIELLSKYAQPDYAIITNIGTAHIGRLGSRENIAKAKCEIISHLKPAGKLITLTDDLYKTTLNTQNITHITIDTNSDDYKLLLSRQNYSKFLYKKEIYELNVGGEYNIYDALLAIEVALQCGLTPEAIQKGLNSYAPIENRFEETVINGTKIINDSYNANPDSMKASIKAFMDLYKGNKVLVLGDMKELGLNEKEYHKEIGLFLNNFDELTLFTIGELAQSISNSTKHYSKHFTNTDEIAKELSTLAKNTVVLLKGSRSMKLESIIEEMKKWL